MATQSITRLDIAGYGCIQNVSVGLTPLHAFVGPNDSGKSTVLRALRVALQLAGGRFEGEIPRSFRPTRFADSAPVSVELTFDRFAYRASWNDDARVDEIARFAGQVIAEDDRGWDDLGILRGEGSRSGNLGELRDYARPARFLRLQPDALRAAGSLITPGKRLDFETDKGRGLAGVLQAINSRNVDTYVALRDEVRRLFPRVRDLLVPAAGQDTAVLQIRLTNDLIVNADSVSEGLLYFLAYTVLQYLDPVSVILIEEPENGLHPARIGEVMRILREISKHTQVILATRSPLVLNELSGDEVTILTRDEAGTHAVRMSDTPRFEERSKVYALGELWVSYANGSDEGPLLQGAARQ